MNERLAFAIEFAKQGLKVFPLQENKKKPLEGSRGFKDATDDITQIQTWWGNHPEYNIGIRTGEVSNLTVIDVDGEGGMESIQTIRHLLPENTRVIKTPHGYHLYFDYSSEFTTGVGFLDGLDVRNNGGYVVASASVAECDKQDCDGEHGNEYTVYRDAPKQTIEIAPDVFKKGTRAQVESTDAKGAISDLIKGTTLGSRDSTLTSFVGRLFHMGLPEEMARAVLYKFADNCDPPLEYRIVDEKIQRMRQVYEYPEPHVREYIDPLQEAYQRMGFVAPGDWLDEPEQGQEWVVDGLVPANTLCMVTAFPKAGKSVFTRHLGLAVANGEPFLGREVKQGRVLYLAIEEPHGKVKSSFRKLGLTEDVPLKLKFDKPDSHSVDDLRLIVRAEKPILVVIDTVTRMPKGKFDLNDYMRNSEWLDPYLYMAHEEGVTIIVNYHSSRNGRLLEGSDSIASPLGSVGIIATPDQIIAIKVESDETRSFSSVGRYESVPQTLLAFDRGTERLSVIGEKSEITHVRLRETIVDILDVDKWKKHADVLEGVSGNAKEKLSALEELVTDKVIDRMGLGKKGSPYEYRRMDIPFPIPTIGTERGMENNWEGVQPTVWEV